MHLDKRSISVNVSLHPTWLLCSEIWLGTLRAQQHLANNDESAFQRWEKQIHTNTTVYNAWMLHTNIKQFLRWRQASIQRSGSPRLQGQIQKIVALQHVCNASYADTFVHYIQDTVSRNYPPSKTALTKKTAAGLSKKALRIIQQASHTSWAKFPLSAPTAAPTQPAPGPAATLARPAPEQPQSCGLGRAKCNNKSEIWRLGTESLDRLCQTQCTLARAARCLGRLQLHQALFVLILTSRWLKRTLHLVYHVTFIVPFLSIPTANHIRIYAHCIWFSSMAGICSNHIAIIATFSGSKMVQSPKTSVLICTH